MQPAGNRALIMEEFVARSPPSLGKKLLHLSNKDVLHSLGSFRVLN